jgi:phosphoribosylformimino-5-aminoimidazole carboxamide ribonucleotide (ProFAR) isomerase
VIYTDIERDGTLSEPNYEATRRVAETGLAVIASGGVASRAQLERLAAIPGVEAAIVGRALYVGAVTIQEPSDWVI